MILKLTGISFADDKKSFVFYPVLIGTESIIEVKEIRLASCFNDNIAIFCSEISSRGAMVTTTYVKESIDQIYKMIK